MSEKNITISLTPGTVVTTTFILIGFWLAFVLRDLLLVILTAIVLASAIEPATVRLMRFRFSRVLAVVFLYVTTLVVLVSVFYLVVPAIVHEVSILSSSFPTYLEALKLSEAGNNFSFIQRFAQIRDILSASGPSMFNAVSFVFGGVMSFILIAVLSFYFAVQDQGLDEFLRLVTPPRKHDYILNLWKRAQYKMGRWLQGQFLLSLIVGVMVYVGLLVLGIPYALLLALGAAFFELVPVFGSILAAIPAVTLAFIAGGTSLALAVIVLYLVVNQVQGNIIYPLVVQKVLGISPIVVILSIIVGAEVGGFLGILISVPVAAAIQEYINDIQQGKRNRAEKEGV